MMLMSSILLASIVFFAFGVFASPANVIPSPSNIKLHTFEFKDDVCEQDKENYLSDLTGWIGEQNVDTLMIKKEIVALVGLFDTKTVETMDKKNVIEKIWPDDTPFLYIQKYKPVSSEHKRSEQPLNSTIESDDDDDDRVFKRDDPTIIQDTKASNELKFLSMAKSEKNVAWNSKSYNYDAKAGNGVTIYIHGDAFNLNHQEFDKSVHGVTKGTVEYLYAQSIVGADNGYFIRGPRPDTDLSGDGTCQADKAIGRLNGVAKGANLKFVPTITKRGLAWRVAGLQAMVNDIKNPSRPAKRDSASGEKLPPVIVFGYKLEPKGSPSFAIDLDSKNPSSFAVKLYRKYLQALVALNAIIIIAAGDDNAVIDQYPALFAGEDGLKENILVVGSVMLDGSKASSSNHGPLVKVSAPAEGSFKSLFKSWRKTGPNGVECAAHDHHKKMNYRHGTSFAAPQAAGLAAELISADPKLGAREVVRKIVNLAWSRGHEDNPKALWNGLEPGSTVRSSMEQMTCVDGEENDAPGCSCVIQ